MTAYTDWIMDGHGYLPTNTVWFSMRCTTWIHKKKTADMLIYADAAGWWDSPVSNSHIHTGIGWVDSCRKSSAAMDADALEPTRIAAAALRCQSCCCAVHCRAFTLLSANCFSTPGANDEQRLPFIVQKRVLTRHWVFKRTIFFWYTS